MSVFAAYIDGYEDGRRARHVDAIFDTFQEASEFVRIQSELGIRLAFRRFESLADVKAFEISANRADEQHAHYREQDERDERYTYLSEQGA